MLVDSLKKKKRPGYPSLGRQWFGIGFTVFALVFLNVAIQNGLKVRDPGGIYFLIVLFVTNWSGLRAGLISTAIIVGFMAGASYIPNSAFRETPWVDRHVGGLGIVLSSLALIVGAIQGRIRKAAIREYDAMLAAETEAEHRRQTELALQASESMWRLVVSAAMDAIVVMRDDGTIDLWNERAETIFGWTSDEIIGRKLADTIIPPSMRDAHIEGLRRFLETGAENIFGKRLELSGMTKDGKEFPIELTVVSHDTGDGHLFIGFARDITEYRKLNDRLRQAQRMEAIGTLAGGIAHDFNNIIAAIAGNTALARADAPSDHAIQESLSEIEKAITRATYIVRQILTFSRNRESAATLVDPAPSLIEAIKLLRAAIPANVEIETRFEEHLPSILVNTTDLHQIILNLGINAAHAMRAHGGRFEVQAIAVTLDEVTAANLLSVSPGPYVRISVGDTGSGMDSQTLQRVFEPFFTTKEVGEGTGLGLSVVYGIVERLGGAITVYSEPGKGTVFHLYFPVGEGAAASSEDTPRHELPGHAERILYVDDDEALVFMMTRMLRRLNYDVTGHQHPGDALDAVRAAPDRFDVLITDMSMPHLDGPDLVAQVRKIRPDLPIVMVTGYIRPEDTEKARALGIDHLVLKPNSVQEMSEVLSGILGREATVAEGTGN